MDIDVLARQVRDLMEWKARVAPMLDEMLPGFERHVSDKAEREAEENAHRQREAEEAARAAAEVERQRAAEAQAALDAASAAEEEARRRDEAEREAAGQGDPKAGGVSS